MTNYTQHERQLIAAGAHVQNEMTTLYRGADVAKSIIKQLRYGDYLSAVAEGVDATGNCGASSYGKNVVKFELPVNAVAVTGAGEFQFKGSAKSLAGGSEYPVEIYRAYNDYYASNYTASEIDSQDNVRAVASQALSGGRDEFDEMVRAFRLKSGSSANVFSQSLD